MTLEKFTEMGHKADQRRADSLDVLEEVRTAASLAIELEEAASRTSAQGSESPPLVVELEKAASRPQRKESESPLWDRGDDDRSG